MCVMGGGQYPSFIITNSLQVPTYICTNRSAKQVKISFKLRASSDASRLKVYGESEWKVKKHGTDGKRRVWRKLHITVYMDTHEIIVAELSLSNMTDTEVHPNYSSKHEEGSLRSPLMELMTPKIVAKLFV